MAIVNGIFTPPLTFEEVANFFGLATSDAGTLWQNANWNMWAKNKPMNIAEYGTLTEEQKQGLSYGIEENTEYSIVGSESWEEAFTNAENGIFSWTYGKPQGGSYPFRSSDVNYYNHNAVCPLFFEAAGEGYVRVGIETESSLPTGNIKLSDLIGLPSMANLSDSYFGILYKKNGGSTVYMIFDDVNGNGLYPCYDADTGEAMSYSIKLGEGKFEVIGIVGAPNHGYFAVLPFAPVSFEYTAPVVKSPVLYGVWGPNSSGSKIRLDFGIEAGDNAVAAGTSITIYLFKEEPATGKNWASTAYDAFTYSVDTALQAGEKRSWTEEIIEISPDKIGAVKAQTRVAGVTLKVSFAYTENFD